MIGPIAGGDMIFPQERGRDYSREDKLHYNGFLSLATATCYVELMIDLFIIVSYITLGGPYNR